MSPSTHGSDGRRADGTFAPGNRLGKGNPLAGRAAKIRAQFLKSANASDVKIIAAKLIEGAKRGDLAFITAFFDRAIGKPSPSDLLERVEALEAAFVERKNNEHSEQG